jgi:hypothetical protein
MSNRRSPRRPESYRRHESRWGRRVGTVQRRPRPVARSARAASKALMGLKPRWSWLLTWSAVGLAEAVGSTGGATITGWTR